MQSVFNKDHLNVTGVCTSNKSEFLAKQYNINVVDINDITYIDLAIDGADEIDSDLNLIKEAVVPYSERKSLMKWQDNL